MSKLDKDFKAETDLEISKGTYFAAKIGTKVVLAIIILCLLGAAGTTAYKFTFAKANKEADREIWKESTTYNEAAATFLADSYKEYNDAEDEAEKAAVMEYVTMRYPNLDMDNIENDDLRRFYKQCINR